MGKHKFTMEARCARLLRKEIEPILRRDDMDEAPAFSIINLMVALDEADKIGITIVPNYKDIDYD